jgi:hypothetical protein
MSSTYEPIATTTLGSAQSTITFSSIPATYTDLIFQYQVQTTDTSGYLWFRLNNDGSSLYSTTRLFGNSGSGSGQSNRGSNAIYLQIDAARSTDNLGSFFVQHQIMNYANTTTNKTILTRESEMNYDYVAARVSLYRSTSAINRIDLIANTTTFAIGSTATLYGIKAE